MCDWGKGREGEAGRGQGGHKGVADGLMKERYVYRWKVYQHSHTVLATPFISFLIIKFTVFCQSIIPRFFSFLKRHKRKLNNNYIREGKIV